MPNLKSQRRALTKNLKYTGLPLPIRARLAKFSIRGDGYLTVSTLLAFGATIVKSWCCECCDPYSSKEWDYKGKRFGTEYGLLDRELSERLQRQHAAKNPPGLPLGELLAQKKAVLFIDEKAEMEKLDRLRGEIKVARRALDDLLSKETRVRDDMLMRKIGDKSPSHLVHGVWDCPTSPTGRCVYEAGAEPAHDACLFCEDPEERT